MFVEIVAGAWNATQFDESESANRRSACPFSVRLVPSVTRPEAPANAPELLYCSCVFEPPGEPLPPVAAIVIPPALLVIVTFDPAVRAARLKPVPLPISN